MLSILPALLLLLLNGTPSCDHLVVTDGARHVANAGLTLSEVCQALASNVLVATATDAPQATSENPGLEPTGAESPVCTRPAASQRLIAQETSRDRDGPAIV